MSHRKRYLPLTFAHSVLCAVLILVFTVRLQAGESVGWFYIAVPALGVASMGLYLVLERRRKATEAEQR
ncbi:hypothetical protein ONR57_22595 [Hoyosella sp. YIM 151337]|uniref:hypothetical protein n=1 Tax=Hoyosella sp. YIM 151337 TaxID=2992742 RepID=UPI0022363634|nr:hypothetical protein [Hoyosella sp. YIM 151337]MCW4356098.1 hypothetical protein [Hoyosella sp. YIM 151337]